MRSIDIVEILIQADGPVCARDLLEASVHLPRRGTRWVAAFRDETGRQVWRSTGMRERESALAVARGWEQEARRKRSTQPPPHPKPTAGVRVGRDERQRGCLSQAEVALILGISERSVRAIEQRAFDKMRDCCAGSLFSRRSPSFPCPPLRKHGLLVPRCASLLRTHLLTWEQDGAEPYFVAPVVAVGV